MTESDHFVHVSGHPCRDELVQMYQWVRPQIAVPMHGEPRQLLAHARLADSCQVPETVVPSDGSVIRLAPGAPQIVDHVQVGRMALDGPGLVPSEGPLMRERRKLGLVGVAVMTLVVDGDGELDDDPQLSLFGLVGDEEEQDLELQDLACDAVEAALTKLKPADKRKDAVVQETARLALRRFLQRETGKKPITHIHVVRLD
jgi:ribonuclease J